MNKNIKLISQASEIRVNAVPTTALQRMKTWPPPSSTNSTCNLQVPWSHVVGILGTKKKKKNGATITTYSTSTINVQDFVINIYSVNIIIQITLRKYL